MTDQPKAARPNGTRGLFILGLVLAGIFALVVILRIVIVAIVGNAILHAVLQIISTATGHRIS
jgi:hypothetical protein